MALKSWIIQSQELGTSSRSPPRVTESQSFGPWYAAFPGTLEPMPKWDGHVAVALPAIPQCQPLTGFHDVSFLSTCLKRKSADIILTLR